ncbi:MAG: hypothetical protein AAGH19_05830 [Pseudomonadota bacterium]
MLLLVSMLFGCSVNGPDPDGAGIRIDGLQFENRTASPITSIQLMAPSTGRFVACGRIAPGARCASAFPDVTYTGNSIIVTWNQGGGEYSTAVEELSVSDEVTAAGAGEVRVVVIAPGSAGILLVPSRGAVNGLQSDR